MPDDLTEDLSESDKQVIRSMRALEADLEDQPNYRLGTVQLDPDTLEQIPGSFVPNEATEIEGDDPKVYGISFPKSMLPIGADQGYWTSEPLLDLNGDEDEELVRVWLHAPIRLNTNVKGT